MNEPTRAERTARKWVRRMRPKQISVILILFFGESDDVADTTPINDNEFSRSAMKNCLKTNPPTDKYNWNNEHFQRAYEKGARQSEPEDIARVMPAGVLQDNAYDETGQDRAYDAEQQKIFPDDCIDSVLFYFQVNHWLDFLGFL